MKWRKDLGWTILLDTGVEKDLKKLGTVAQKKIFKFLRNLVITHDDPRIKGKALQGRLTNLWRYRVGDYRIICKLIDKELTLLVVHVGHRKHIYKKYKPKMYEI